MTREAIIAILRPTVAVTGSISDVSGSHSTAILNGAVDFAEVIVNHVAVGTDRDTALTDLAGIVARLNVVIADVQTRVV